MNKSQRFGLVLTPRERETLKELAEAAGGLSQAAALRCLIRREAQRRGLWKLSEKRIHVEDKS
jgi:hypothetical protein